MTILRPHHKARFRGTLLLLGTMLVVGGFLYVREYSALANDRYIVKQLRQTIVNEKTLHAELKDKEFGAMKMPDKATLIAEYNLILDTHPIYILPQTQ